MLLCVLGCLIVSFLILFRLLNCPLSYWLSLRKRKHFASVALHTLYGFFWHTTCFGSGKTYWECNACWQAPERNQWNEDQRWQGGKGDLLTNLIAKVEGFLNFNSFFLFSILISVENAFVQEMEATVVDGNGTETGHIIVTTIGGRNGQPKQVDITKIILLY